jgi:hypothetical protein
MVLVILIVLIGCAPEVLTLTKVGMIRRGMPSSELSQIIDIEPSHVFKWEHNDGMTICIYNYPIGSYRDDYFLYFQNSKLIFWGYPHEFSRSSNDKYHRVLQIALEKLRVIRELENMRR